MMTLREVCEAVGVSRRAIQGYEKAKLVSSTAKNDRCYLLYDQKAIERIQKIKLFQDMGFSLKMIKEIIDAPNSCLKQALEIQIKRMEEDIEHKGTMIIVAKEIIAKL